MDELSSKLLVNALEAAKLLAISPRTLWTLTNEGNIPCVRIGRSVRYSVVELQTWIDQQKEGGATE